ncbi:hypothetical protein GQ55_2G342500 [Panicum hallii var. hallii]|uniref:DUF674 domain-containing protein n=2 Tax=Panicum hallii TaxID=206008 RepID=A0A2T7EVC5_9POAL|nr:uncharacterized protein LOC112882209 [Panicum hallii]PAN13632.1 hypothetical protein PAHAL_2G352700 [Panicum hallii]PUZ71786.1 hypothetical protein GQ55_2G342500 [Panicum hallii var. hallii]
MASATAAKDATPALAPAAGGPQLKLLVDKRSRRVLYAEARKDAVDFLIGLLRVPAGLAARALAKHGERAPGSLGSLYAGARDLDDAFFASAPPDRDALLSPALPSAAVTLLLGEDALPPPPPPPPPPRYFRCSAYVTPCRANPTNVTDVSGTPCPACRQPMTVEMRWAPGDAHGRPAPAQAREAGGYVKEVVTYLVMDDLTVAPMSTISAIMLLKKFSVKDCSALEEMTVELGTKEAVMLLKSSLQSSTALTDVFSGGVSIDRIDG